MSAAPQILVVSGLSPVETDPWQAWLEARFPYAAWVRPLDGDWPDLGRWSQRIEAALARGVPGRPWLALAHGFGALALVHHAVHGLRSPAAALLLAPASPHRFGQDVETLGHPIPYPTALVALQGGAHPASPWLQDDEADRWASLWGSKRCDAGAGPSLNGTVPWPEGAALLAAHGVATATDSKAHIQARFASLAR